MIGYDIGARFAPDDALSGLSGDAEGLFTKGFDHSLSIDRSMDAVGESGLPGATGNIAESYDALNAASELLVGMQVLGGTGGGPGIEPMPEMQGPLHIAGYDYGVSAFQRMSRRDRRDEMSISSGDAQPTSLYSTYGGILGNTHSGLGQTTASENFLTAGNAVGSLIGLPTDQPNFELGGRSSFIDGPTSAAINSQRLLWVSHIPGLTENELNFEHVYPRSPEAVEEGAQSDQAPHAGERYQRELQLLLNVPTGADDPEAHFQPRATRIIGEGSNAFGGWAPEVILKNSSAKLEGPASIGSALSNHAMHADVLGPFSGSGDKATYARFIDGLGRILPDSPMGGQAVRERDVANNGAAIADLNPRFDQLSSLEAAATDRWETLQQVGDWQKLGQRWLGAARSNLDEALKTQSGLSAHLFLNGISDDESLTGHAGMWGMLRNAERVLPKQSTSAGRGGYVATAETSEGPEPGAPHSLGKSLSKGNANLFDQEPAGIRATNISSNSLRSAPSGHKNDPIYTVAICQTGATSMPMVPTAGTTTRSPAIPGQRNLP